jgi:hypothetical protein
MNRNYRPFHKIQGTNCFRPARSALKNATCSAKKSGSYLALATLTPPATRPLAGRSSVPTLKWKQATAALSRALAAAGKTLSAARRRGGGWPDQCSTSLLFQGGEPSLIPGAINAFILCPQCWPPGGGGKLIGKLAPLDFFRF